MSEPLEQLIAALPSDPVLRGRSFERLCKWLLETDPQYAGQLRKVWLWNDWPDCPGTDLGIDLVAETQGDKLWAVQAKAYDSTRSVTKRDIDTFLSASSSADFAARLLIATTDHLAHNARRTIREQEKPVQLLLLNNLRQSAVHWPCSLDELTTGSKAEPKQPYSHQRAAIQDIVHGLARVDRGQLIMPCGTGKTLVSLWLSREMDAARTLVLVPSLSLMRQTISEWTANADEPLDILAVCSDDSVTGSDEAVHHVYELPWPVTTDPSAVYNFLRSGHSGPKVVFCTYQSSPVVSEAQRLGAPALDLGLADEAHRCAGKNSGPFATILDGQAIQARKRLFVTATPRYVADHVSRRAQELGLELVSMDDEAVFGPVLHKLSFGTAVRKGLLCNYRVVVMGVSDQEVAELLERSTFLEAPTGQVTDARALGAQVAIIRAMREFDIRRVISFHSRVKRAKTFAEGLSESWEWFPSDLRPEGELWSGHVSGKMNAGRRRRALDRLASFGRNEYTVLTNARCLVEGVNVRSLDAVVFVDPKASQIDIVQAVGRVMRTSPDTDKTVGTVVIPVAIDSDADPESVLDNTSFSVVWSVVKALRAHDADFGATLDQARVELGRTGTLGRVSDRIVLRLGTRVDASFTRHLWLRTVESVTSIWEYGYGKLLAYVEREGNARVPQRHKEDGFPLGVWVASRRSGRAILPKDRAARLEALPGWVWNEREARWEEAFSALERYVAREGHAKVPSNHIEGGVALGRWVDKQRRRRADLPRDRADRLEALPDWVWVWDAWAAQWEEAFSVLERYVAREGHARVSQRHHEEGFPLGAWVGTQRAHHVDLSEDRVERLEALPGWVWHTKETQWEEAFSALERYATREGHARPPYAHEEDGFALGQWVDKQRSRKASIRSDRATRLEALPGWVWNEREARWEEAFSVLERYVAREGHARVPSNHIEDGVALGRWVIRLRQERFSMQAKRAERLEALPGWVWHTKETQWEEAFFVLERYVAREGHARVPSKYAEGRLALGAWVVAQRRKRSSLDEDKVARLEALPGWIWHTKEAQWDEAFSALERYATRKGHARPPYAHEEDGFALGKWVTNLRRQRASMRPDRVARLEALPGWAWDAQEARWEEAFATLERYVAREGHAKVPSDHNEDGLALGTWVQNRRRQRASMRPDRAARLEALRGWKW